MARKKYQKGSGDDSPRRFNQDLPPQGDAWPRKELFLLEPRTLFIIILTSVLTLGVTFFGGQGAKFFTSVISPVPEHAPFDGTAYPVKEVPNWVKLTEEERKVQFSALPQNKIISTPSYNPSRLAIPLATLKWNDPNDDAIRNEKITYSVPYLGNYKLDGLEGAGSHPAVDIKVPIGTPVYAIANGTVIKAINQSSGFGNHIVIQHNNVPALDDPNKLTTLYSSYSHLSSVGVQDYEVVVKGQLIGFSGDTGTATTPHIHFQIDSSDAPWHPYWPFNSSEMNTAGYSFFEAINAGLGQGNAAKNTINPTKYVQKYFGEQALVASNAPVPNSIVAADEYDNLSFVLQLVDGLSYNEGAEVKFIVQAFDKNGNLLTKPKFEDEIIVSLLNNSSSLTRDQLQDYHFRTGISDMIKIKSAGVGKDKLILRFRNNEFSSNEFEVVAGQTVQPPAPAPAPAVQSPVVSPPVLQAKAEIGGFFIEVEKPEIKINESTDVRFIAVDGNGNQISNFEFSTDPVVYLNYESIGSLSHASLAASDFINGVATVKVTGRAPGSSPIFIQYNFKPFGSQAITVRDEVAEAAEAAEAVEVTEAADPVNSVEPSSTNPPAYLAIPPFADVPLGNKYYEALAELKNAGLVAGYDDGSFKPDKEVSRAEAITFILRIIDEQIRKNLNITFPDVKDSAWYRDFVGTAFGIGFVKGYPDGYFRPDVTVNLAEFLTMLFVGAKSDIDPQITITLPDGVPESAWFAPYLQEAIRKGIIDSGPGIIVNAGSAMTRGEIAEILYRLRKLESSD